MGKKLGEYLRKQRKEKKYTVIAVAERSGLAKSTVDYIEAGQRNPSLSSIAKYAAALGMEDISEAVSIRLFELVVEASMECHDDAKAYELINQLGDVRDFSTHTLSALCHTLTLSEQATNELRCLVEKMKKGGL